MAGLNFNRAPKSEAADASAPVAGNNVAPLVRPKSGDRTDRNGVALPKAQLWLNAGLTLAMPQEDGTTEDIFVALPFGLPLDTMSRAEARGNSPESAMLAAAKNHILDLLLEQAGDLAPGQDVTVQLELQIRRVGQPATVADGDNPLIASLNAMFGKTK